MPKFEFYSSLKKSDNEIANDSYSHNKERVVYYLKVASLSSKKEAGYLVSSLQDKGLHPVMRHVILDDISWWRIYVGPFSTMRDTYSSQNSLRSENYDSVLVKGPV